MWVRLNKSVVVNRQPQPIDAEVEVSDSVGNYLIERNIAVKIKKIPELAHLPPIKKSRKRKTVSKED